MTSITNFTVRVLSTPKCLSPVNVHGRIYSAGPAQALDVPFSDADILGANAWIRICHSGPTSARPTMTGTQGGDGVLDVGKQFFDSTLGYVIYFDGLVWRNPNTGAAV
ncbi:MAG: hypothetical protein ACYDCJ_00915 [Gammaproteobacteria bacterium]